MLQTNELINDHIIRSLRIYAEDLINKYSPFRKDEAYFRELASWLTSAATRIEKLSGIENKGIEVDYE